MKHKFILTPTIILFNCTYLVVTLILQVSDLNYCLIFIIPLNGIIEERSVVISDYKLKERAIIT